MPTQKFHVRGLDHGSESSVEERLRALEGVLFAAANHEDECAEVEFEDDVVTPAEICAVLAALGYDAAAVG